MIRQVPILLLLLLSGMLAHGQSIGPATLDAAGGSSAIGSDTYEFALGQAMAGHTFSNTMLVVTPGVLQPASGTTGLSRVTIAAHSLSVFPAPADRFLFLQPAFNTAGKLQFSLMDVSGKQVLSGAANLKTGNEQQRLDLSPYAAGDYVLQVSWEQGGTSYTSGYKVQKLQ